MRRAIWPAAKIRDGMDIMTKTKADTKPSLPNSGLTALSRTIDEALTILASNMADDDQLHSDSAPLPNLLERCEAALALSRRDSTPLRVLHKLPGMDDGGCTLLLKQIPNVRLLPPRMILSNIEDEPCMPSLYADAEGAALLRLLSGYEANGLLPVMSRDHGFHSAERGAAGISVSRLPDVFRSLDREIRELLLVRHPRLAYLDAQERGLLGSHPVSLETYSEACSAFLAENDGLPHLPIEQIAARADLALEHIAAIYDLALPPDLAPRLKMEGMDFFLSSIRPTAMDTSLSSASLRSLDEPLDTPAYRGLCEQLGYDPEKMPEQAPSLPVEPIPRRPLPPRRANSRLSSFLPRLAHVTDSAPQQATGGERIGACLDAAALVALVEDCLDAAEGFYERLDTHLRHLSSSDSALLLICSAAHYAGSGQSVHALGLLAEAEELIEPGNRAQRLLSADLLLRLKKPDLALATLVADALTGPSRLEAGPQATLKEALARLAPSEANEHGQTLLLNHLRKTPPDPIDRKRVMIEIGTTREPVPGQGSTAKLAQLCRDMGIDFITVDMDPRNSAMARRMFEKEGFPFQAITAKGEDFLADWQGMIDYCFLDAYDFDHGQHSELRQSRYATFLGDRISDAACHKMHFDCATSLIKKLSPDGLICFDDTWTDTRGEWTAKGKTAMPYLLENGFRVMEARNRSALLTRC